MLIFRFLRIAFSHEAVAGVTLGELWDYGTLFMCLSHTLTRDRRLTIIHPPPQPQLQLLPTTVTITTKTNKYQHHAISDPNLKNDPMDSPEILAKKSSKYLNSTLVYVFAK